MINHDLRKRLGIMADFVVRTEPKAFTRAKSDEIVLLLREAEKELLEPAAPPAPPAAAEWQSVRVSRTPSTDRFTLSIGEGRTVGTLTRAEALRIATDIIELGEPWPAPPVAANSEKK